MSQRPNNLFYAAGEDLRNTIRVEIKLTEPVEPAALAQAASFAASRFPYFAVKLVRDGEQFILEQNDAPFVITHGIRPVRLNSAQSGGVSVEIFSCADDFIINIMQRSEDPGIITEIRKLFGENGIVCHVEKAGHFEVAEFEMP